jgi:HEAT repeat protein
VRGLKIFVVCAALVGTVMAVWLAPALAAEERTRIDLRIEDDANQSIERAQVEFLREDGSVAATHDFAGHRWIPIAGPTESEGWGRNVAQARISAFGCRRTLPLVMEREKRGSLFGRFSPHPVPLTYVYVLQGELRCPTPSESNENGITLAQLAREIAEGEPYEGPAAEELIRIGPLALEAMPQVIAVLERSRTLSLRADLIRALGAMGPGAAGAVGSLAPLLGDPDPRLHRVVATALEKIGPRAPGVVEALAKAARSDPDRQTQDHIIRILGRMGRAAQAAEPDLVAILEDESEEEPVRRAAFSALGHLESPTSREAQARYAKTHPILY